LNNQYDVLSGEDEDEIDRDTDQCDSSKDMQVTDNAQQCMIPSEESYQLAQSRRNQRQKSKAIKKSLPSSSPTKFLSSATKATLDRARKAKELLTSSSNLFEGLEEMMQKPPARDPIEQLQAEKDSINITPISSVPQVNTPDQSLTASTI
jgi:hypothetical protein